MEPIGGLLILLWLLSNRSTSQSQQSGFVGPIPPSGLPRGESPVIGFQPGPTGTLVGTPTGTGSTFADPVPAPAPISVLGTPQAAPAAPLPTLIPVTPPGTTVAPNPVAPSPRPGTSYSVADGPTQVLLPGPLKQSPVDDGRPDFCEKAWIPIIEGDCPAGSFEPAPRRGVPPPGTAILTGPIPGALRRLAGPACPDPRAQGGIHYMLAGSEEWNAICGTGPKAITQASDL